MNKSVVSKEFSIQESIRYGWDMFKEHWALLVGATILVASPSFVVGAIGENIETLLIVEALLLLGFAVLGILLSFGYYYIGLRLYSGVKVALEDLFTPVNKLWSFIAASFLYAIIVLFGLLLFIIPGVVWSIKYRFYPYIILDEDAGPLESLKRSGVITEGVKWRLFLLFIVLNLLNLLGFLFFGLGVIVTKSIELMAIVCVYYIIKEGTDRTTPPALREDVTPATTE